MKEYHPPTLAHHLLRLFLRDDLYEDVSGDLEEKFFRTLNKSSPFRARMIYWRQVFNYMRPFAFKRKKLFRFNSSLMFQNYFKVGFRSLMRNKGYSLINTTGLAVGMAVAMLIGLWINDEVTFNTYHENYDRIGQIYRQGTFENEVYTNYYLPGPLAEELRTEYGTSFKDVVNAWLPREYTLSIGEKKLWQNGMFIEPAGPRMFTLTMLAGDWEGLKNQNSILLSASTAKALFGNDDPLGQAINIDNQMNVTVTGVYEDLPANTALADIRFFAPWDLVVSVNPWVKEQGFGNNFLTIYAQLAPTTDFERASDHIKDAILNNIPDNKGYQKIHPQVFIHPMSKWHLNAEWKNGVNTGGLVQFVWLFGIVGAFVLLLACINFMNLSTARSEKRAKEVGIRKAIGSVRAQLINQFLSESLLVVAMSFVIALIIVMLVLPAFNSVADKHITMTWTNPLWWLCAIGFMLFTGLLAGSYPAFYLSRFEPVKVLKGVIKAGRFASLPRKVLVVIQFTVSVTLVIGTIIVYEQIQYAMNRPVGYERSGLIMIPTNSPEYNGKFETIRSELKNTNAVVEVALSQSPATGVWSSNGGVEWRGKDPEMLTNFGTLNVSHEYGATVNWTVTEGRDFSRELASDSSAVILTKTAVDYMKLKDPLGEVITWDRFPGKKFTVVGVVADMVMQSPYQPVMPTIFFTLPGYNWINIKINPDVSTSEALVTIQSVMAKVVPQVPFSCKFVDEEYDTKFKSELRIGQLALLFTVLAVIISCLGLFGLASFIAEQRTKEIGIRKIVGASVFALWKLLTRDFVILVTFSCLIAIPIASSFLSGWLKNYEYRITISWWIYFFAAFMAITITLITVSYQSIKAANMNPSKSLRAD